MNTHSQLKYRQAFRHAKAGVRPTVGYLYVLSVPYVAAIGSINGLWIGGLHYHGFMWSGFLALGALLILYHKERLVFPFKVWLPWFAYVFLSIAWGGIHGRHNVQDPLQMITPLVVGIVASFSIRNKHQVTQLIWGFAACLMFIGAVFVFFQYGPGAPYQKGDFGYNYRPAAMTVCLLGCLFVARMLSSPFRSLLGWSACLAIATFSGSRMAMFILLIIPFALPVYRRTSTRILVLAVMCALAVSVFYSPIFQARSFGPEGGGLRDLFTGNFNTAGRFEGWPLIWEEAKRHMIFGAGAGESVWCVSKIWPGTIQPHNDYLRILFEYGIIGLVLLLGAVLSQIYSLRRMARLHAAPVGWLSTAGYLGFFAMLILFITDNAIVYGIYFLHPLFAIVGAAYGLQANRHG